MANFLPILIIVQGVKIESFLQLKMSKCRNLSTSDKKGVWRNRCCVFPERTSIVAGKKADDNFEKKKFPR
jgi:hypothetical protein